MKADESRSTMPPRHQLDHELPPVLHHPDEEMPLLARWLDRAMQNQTRFWTLIGAVVVIALGLSVLGSGLTLGRAATDQAWTKLETAKNAAERVEVAKEFPKTPAERWALLQAATEYYNQGFNDLPAHRDAALPNLKLALKYFQQVADEAEPNSPQARAAALGVARTLEAQNERVKAIARYERVAENKAWAGTGEARAAARYAKALKSPEAETFYKELYAYTPPATTIPAGGVGNLDLPFPVGHPPVNVPGMTPSGNTADVNPADLPPPPPRPDSKTETKDNAATKSASDGLPLDLIVPSATPKAGTTKPGATGLPDDVFAPDAKSAAPK